MKKLIFSFLLFYSCFASAQVFQKIPVHGSEFKGLSADSALFIPTGCGAPTKIMELPKSALYGDSCNNLLYKYNPKDSTWGVISGRDSAAISLDSIKQPDDTSISFTDAQGNTKIVTISGDQLVNDSYLTTGDADGRYLPINNPSYTGLMTGTGPTQTGSSSVPVLNLNQTWNLTNGTPAIIKGSVTNNGTLSGDLLNFLVNGVSAFRVNAQGNIFATNNIIGRGYSGSVIASAGGLTKDYSFLSNMSFSDISGDSYGYENTDRFSDTSSTGGTTAYNAFSYIGAISQSSGRTGITRGLYIAPTLFTPYDWRSIETENSLGYGIYQGGGAKNYFSGNTNIAGTLIAGTNSYTGNPQITIAKTINTPGENAHGFSDQSVFTTPNMAYAAYDARGVMQGGKFDHYSGFQSAVTVNSSDTLSFLYSHYSLPTIQSGVVLNNYGYFSERANVTGGGKILNDYGLYIDAPIAGTLLNYAIFTNGTALSQFGGGINSAGTIKANKLFVGSNTLDPVKNIEVHVNNGNEAALRLWQEGRNYWDFKNPVNSTSLVIGDITKDYFTILNGGWFGFNTLTPTTKFEVNSQVKIDSVLTGASTDSFLTIKNGIIGKIQNTLANGTFVPAISNVTNIASYALNGATYQRNGNIVTGRISFSFTPTAANANSTFTFSLPVTTTNGSQTGIGSFECYGAGVQSYGGIVSTASTTTATDYFYTTSTTTMTGVITFQYSL